MTTTIPVSDQLKSLAKDLASDYPRSPRETLADYVLAARMLDKCRAELNGTNGEYHFNCPLDKQLLDFTGINAEEFKQYVATGASDEDVAEWIRSHSKVQERGEIIRWSNQKRDARLSDLPIELQIFMADYIEQYVPKHRPVYHFYDVFDLEEGRL